MGTVSGGGTYFTGETTTIIATPADGYRFVQWNDGNTEASRQIRNLGTTNFTAYFDKIYNVGDIGPSGGIIFVDIEEKGWTERYSPYKYLEVAQADVYALFSLYKEGSYNPNTYNHVFGYYKGYDRDINPSLLGQVNTKNLYNVMKNEAVLIYTTEPGLVPYEYLYTPYYAANLCFGYVPNDDDNIISSPADYWFLPSRAELAEMYNALKLNGLGDFSDEYYWSSTEYTDLTAFALRFSDGNVTYSGKNERYRVRPIRGIK